MKRALFRGAACALFAVLLVLLVSIAPPEAGAGSCYPATTYATQTYAQTYATPVYAVSYIPVQVPTYSTGYGNPNETLEKEVKGLREELKALVTKQQPAPPVQVPQPMPPGYPPPQSYGYPSPYGYPQGYPQQQGYYQPQQYPPQQQAGYYAPQGPQSPPYGYPQQPSQQLGPQEPLPAPAKDGGSLSYLQVFNARCASCHDSSTAKEKGNGFVITEGGALTKNLDVKSVLRIAARCYDGTMPPSKMGRPLNDQEVGAVMAWVSAIR